MTRFSLALFAILLLAAPAARNETRGLEFMAICVGSVLKAIVVEVPGPADDSHPAGHLRQRNAAPAGPHHLTPLSRYWPGPPP